MDAVSNTSSVADSEIQGMLLCGQPHRWNPALLRGA